MKLKKLTLSLMLTSAYVLSPEIGSAIPATGPGPRLLLTTPLTTPPRQNNAKVVMRDGRVTDQEINQLAVEHPELAAELHAIKNIPATRGSNERQNALKSLLSRMTGPVSSRASREEDNRTQNLMTTSYGRARKFAEEERGGFATYQDAKHVYTTLQAISKFLSHPKLAALRRYLMVYRARSTFTQDGIHVEFRAGNAQQIASYLGVAVTKKQADWLKDLVGASFHRGNTARDHTGTLTVGEKTFPIKLDSDFRGKMKKTVQITFQVPAEGVVYDYTKAVKIDFK